jgi:nucleotide-binding universal stress UspA family protein
VEATREPNQWIVAAVDGSAAAERGLHWAIDEAKLRGASVRIVTAWHVPVAAYAAHGASPPPSTSLRDEIREAAETVAAAAAKAVSAQGDLPAETRVVEGKPGDVLIDNSRGAELLVLGARPEGTLPALLTNSVAVQCALHAPAPTVIVR